MDDLPILERAPPLDPAWLAHEAASDLLAPKPFVDPVARQPLYAAQCRRRDAAMMQPGARDHRLSRGVRTRPTSVPSTSDPGHAIPVLQYDRAIPSDTDTGASSEQPDPDPAPEPDCVIVYYHGGGLLVGEPDSEDLSCRRLLLDSAPFLPRLRLYSVGYRLRPQHPVRTCVADAVDALAALAARHPDARLLAVGSSSGGQLAAIAAQHAAASVGGDGGDGGRDRRRKPPRLHGVLLRCPVTSDAGFRPKLAGAADADAAVAAAATLEHVPEALRGLHTSARDPSFGNALLTRLYTDPREGLEGGEGNGDMMLTMPLEAAAGAGRLRGMPRTWVQVCTNDVLYSDGACYAEALRDAGVEVRTDVVVGWPHTFWLKAPELERALEAERALLEGLAWVVEAEAT